MPTPPLTAFRLAPRWRRLLRWCLWLVLISGLCLAISALWLSQNQTPVVNSLLVRFAPDLGASVGLVSTTPTQVTLHDVVLRDPTNGQELLRLPEIHWTPEWSTIHQGQLGKLILKDVALDLTEAKLNQLLALGKGSAKPDKVKASSGIKMAAIELQNVSVRTSGTGLPTAEFILDQKVKDIDLSDPSHPHIGSFSTKLRNMKLANGDGLQSAVTIPSLQLSGGLSRDDGILRINALKVGDSVVALTPTLLGAWQRWINPEPPPTAVAVPTVAKQPSTVLAWFKGFEIHAIDLDYVSISALADTITPTPTWWPNITGSITSHLSDLNWTPDIGLQLGPQTVVLKNFELRPPTGVGRLAARELSIVISGMTSDALVNVQEATLDAPLVEWTPELERYLVAAPTIPSTHVSLHPNVDEPPHKPIVRAINGAFIHHLLIREGKVSMHPTSLLGYYTTSSDLESQIEDLRITSAGVTSSKPQSLRLSDLKATESLPSRSTPPEPFAELSSAIIRIVPDEWNARQGIAELTLTKPILHARADTTSWFAPAPTNSGPPASGKPSKASPWWLNTLHFDKLQLTEGSIDFANAASPRIDARTNINITTEPSTEGPMQRIRWDKIQGNLPEHAALPIASIDSVEVTVQWPQALTTKRLNELSIKGAELDVNEALMTLLAPSSPESEATKARGPATDTLAGWRINKLAIADTAITLHRIAPGLPPVKFDVDYEAFDMPLAPSEIAGNFQSQRVELSQLAIRSPYNSRHEVMRMDTIFVNFTLDGLLARRIDTVEVISPTVYIGEDLFWYVDYYRKYAAGEPLPDAPIDRIALAATDNITALQAATDLTSKPVKEGTSWTVDTLQVEGGKLVIASKGTPLPGIPRPFPFSFTTKMNQGHIIADLDIPEDTYTWEQMKLQLERMRGRVQFNLPIKSRDNNLNEVFRIDRIRYKKLHIEDAHLSITYDVNGIYGQFGGQAYEGYVNGAFNVYLDDSFTWDGWISGTAVKTTEITEQLCPAYLMLDGKVDLTVIAQGDEDEIYQSDIKFKNASPGKFSIQALNDFTSSLPADTASYSRAIMRIGVETLRDFDYNKVDGNARFFGREGKGYLKFSGPHGSRNFDINVYDHRMQFSKTE